MATRVSVVSGPTLDTENSKEAKGTEVKLLVDNKFKSSYSFSAPHIMPVTIAKTFLFSPRADATVNFGEKGIGKGTGQKYYLLMLTSIQRGFQHTQFSSHPTSSLGRARWLSIKVLVRRPDTLGLIPGTFVNVAEENQLYTSPDNHGHTVA